VNRCDVVVLTWNDDPEMVDTAVASALGQRGCDVRVLLIDNGSAPPARPSPDDRVVLLRNEENLGVGGGRNLGVSTADAPFVCLLDSDARLHDGTLERLLRPLLDDPTIGLTAPVFTGQRPEASGGKAPTLRRKIARGLNRTDVYARTPNQGLGGCWDVDFVIGACQVFRRSVFDAVGGIDDSAAFGPEDVDFCLRVRAAGSRVVQVANAGCDHPPRRAFKGLTSMRGMRHSAAVLRHLWRYRAASSLR
jgi:GT2 family glycosyltransferase